ncbi:MAG: helix-turn-helix domain-containing protein [Clostridia bacterium]|nr:helix-turn-helix domain-containing protein [Clostridia bacterium]
MKLKKIYHSWMISYLIIICVAFFCSTGIYLMIGAVVKQEVNRSNTVILENVRLSTDTYINDMQKMAMDIRNNSLVNTIYNNELNETEFSYLSTQIQKELSRYQTMNTNIDTIYLYLKERDYVIATNRSVDADTMYDVAYKNTGITKEEWKSILFDHPKSGFRQLPAIADGEKKQQLALLNPLPAMSKEPKAVLVVAVSGEIGSRALKNGGFVDDGVLFLMDSKNQIVMSSHEKELPVTYEMLEQESRQKIRFDGKSYVITSAKSSAMNMRYVLGIPNNTYYKTAIVIRNIAFIGVFAFLVLALYAAFHLLKKNYRPLRELMGYVHETYGKMEEEENEYHVFQTAITKAVKEKALMQNKLKQQNNTVREHMLGNLLKGKNENNLQIEDILFSNGVDFKGKHNRVLVFYMEYFDALFEGSSKEVEEQTALAFLVVRNITKELLDCDFTTVFVEVDDMMVCLLNAQEQDEKRTLIKIKETVKEAKEIIKSNFYIDFTVSISSAYEAVKEVATAYQEAMEAMDYKMIIGSGGTICYEELEVTQENYYYPMEAERIIVNALKAGDEEKANEILEELYSRNFQKESLSLAMAKCFISNLVSTVLKVLEDIRIQQGVNVEVDMEEINRILAGTDVAISKQKMLEIFHIICSQTQQRTESSARRIVKQVKEYIAENYMDFNLSLYSIAEECHITYTHLSRVFKLETGMGLLQYINEFRMEIAKKHLLETDQSVAQIAESVGYGNSNSLIRAFKKYNGITPGKFRELNKPNKES